MLNCVNLIISVNVDQDVEISQDQQINELCDMMNETSIKNQDTFHISDLLETITKKSLKE